MVDLGIQVSEQVGELVKALASAQATYTVVTKNKRGQPFGGKAYMYADWSKILEMMLPKLSAHGLAFVQNTFPCIEDGNLYVQSALFHTSGQFIKSYFPVCSLKSTKQQDFGSNLTYAKRYGGSALLGISTEEDTDAQGSDIRTSTGSEVPHDPETGEVAHKQATPTAQKPEVTDADKERHTARKLFDKLVSDILTSEDIDEVRLSIKNDLTSENAKKLLVPSLTAAADVRYFLSKGNTPEDIDDAKEALSRVNKNLLTDGKLQSFINKKLAEIEAAAIV